MTSSICCTPQVHIVDNDAFVCRSNRAPVSPVSSPYPNSFHDNRYQLDPPHQCCRKLAYISHNLGSRSPSTSSRALLILLSSPWEFRGPKRQTRRNLRQPHRTFVHVLPLLPPRRCLFWFICVRKKKIVKCKFFSFHFRQHARAFTHLDVKCRSFSALPSMECKRELL